MSVCTAIDLVVARSEMSSDDDENFLHGMTMLAVARSKAKHPAFGQELGHLIRGLRSSIAYLRPLFLDTEPKQNKTKNNDN